MNSSISRSTPRNPYLLLTALVAVSVGCEQEQTPLSTGPPTATTSPSTVDHTAEHKTPALPAENARTADTAERTEVASSENLAAAIDTDRDVIRGRVEHQGNTLRVIGQDALTRIPFRIVGDYRISTRVRRSEGNQQIVLIFPVRERHACVVLDWNTHDLHGLETVDGQNLGNNQLGQKIPFETGRWYDLNLSVKQQGTDAVVLESNLDGQRLFHWKGDAASLTLWDRWQSLEPGTMGLANWDASPGMIAEYEQFKWTSLGGTATPLAGSRTRVPPARETAASENSAPRHIEQSSPSANTVPPATSRSVPIVRLPAGDDDWPCFRGPGRLGVSANRGVPLEWSDQENILWKRKLPGPGTSSPIVWGDHIYLTSYSGYGESVESPGRIHDLRRHLVCLDRETGHELWTADLQSTTPEHGYTGVMALHGYASSTPVADETGVYVMYGASGAASYTHEGELRWQRSLGTGTHGWGSSASPVLFENLVIFHADIEGRGLVALDKRSSEQVWRVPTGQGDSWSTPALATVNDRAELIFHHSQGHPHATVSAVNPRDGSALWHCHVLQDYLAPSPVVVGEMCYLLGYARGAAVRLGGGGDVTDSHVLWTTHKGTEICTPIYHLGHLYWVHQENGIAYCLDAGTGDVVYEQRIQPTPGKIYASGVLADGKIYCVSRERGTYVIAAEPEYRLLAHNQIASDRSIFNATPAVTRGQLLIRSDKFLYCIGKE